MTVIILTKRVVVATLIYVSTTFRLFLERLPISNMNIGRSMSQDKHSWKIF